MESSSEVERAKQSGLGPWVLPAQMLRQIRPLFLQQLDLLWIVLTCDSGDPVEAKGQIDGDRGLLRLLSVLDVVGRRAQHDGRVDLIRREVFFGQLLKLLSVQLLFINEKRFQDA